ncbi:unnamed protein product [Gadus morhua 'NCC']
MQMDRLMSRFLMASPPPGVPGSIAEGPHTECPSDRLHYPGSGDTTQKALAHSAAQESQRIGRLAANHRRPWITARRGAFQQDCDDHSGSNWNKHTSGLDVGSSSLVMGEEEGAC